MNVAYLQSAPSEAFVDQKDWRSAGLGELCRIVGGSTPDSKNPDYWGGNLVWVTPTDLGRLPSRRIDSSTRFITEAGLENCGAEILPVGSVVMSSRAPIGHIGIAAVGLCTNQGCKTFLPGPEIDNIFLYWLLLFRMDHIKSLGSGTTFSEVSKTQLQSMRIKVPPLQEQRRIARALDEQMAAVARARVQAEKQRRHLDRIRCLAFEHVIDQQRRTWPSLQLRELCEGNGQYGLSIAANAEGRGVPILRMGNIQDGSLDLSDLRWVEIDDATLSAYRIKAGDVLFNRTNSAELVGKTALVEADPPEAVFASYLVRFRCRPELLYPSFLATMLNSSIGRDYVAKNMGRAIGQVNISAGRMHEFPVPCPSLDSQQAIMQQVNAVIEQAERASSINAKQCRAIDGLSPALLRAAFSGTL